MASRVRFAFQKPGRHFVYLCRFWAGAKTATGQKVRLPYTLPYTLQPTPFTLLTTPHLSLSLSVCVFAVWAAVQLLWLRLSFDIDSSRWAVCLSSAKHLNDSVSHTHTHSQTHTDTAIRHLLLPYSCCDFDLAASWSCHISFMYAM